MVTAMWRRFVRAPALCALAFLLAACAGSTPVGPAPEPEEQPPQAAPEVTRPDQQGALAALEAYAGARKALDFAGAYEALTPVARGAFSQVEFAETYKGQQSFTFTGVEVEEPADGVARGYVRGLVIVREDVAYRYDRYPYTLRYEEGRWGVAQGTGLALRALQAFDRGEWDENLKLASQWLEIDPYAWEPYLERFYVYKDTGRPDEARAAWDEAFKLAPPEEQPHLYDLLAMLHLLAKDGEALRLAAQRALEGADKLGKVHADRYGLTWRAGVVIDLAYAHRYLGDTKKAHDFYLEAQALDPKNMDVERFQRTLPGS